MMPRNQTLFDIQIKRRPTTRKPSPVWLRDLRRKRFRRPGHFYITKHQRAAIHKLARETKPITIDPALRPKDRR